MSVDKLTVREMLGTQKKGFDPLDFDTSEIRELSNALPRDGNIDTNNAENLATKYLRGADICGELLAIATAYVGKCKDKKSIAYNRAFIKYKDDKTVKTDKLRTSMAEVDEDYIEACGKYNEAIAFAKWIDIKYSSFIRMHYLCKKILERGYAHEQANSWNGGVDEQEYEKDPW